MNLKTPHQWTLPAIFGLHQKAKRALDVVAGLTTLRDELLAAEGFLCECDKGETALLARTRTLIGSVLGRQGDYKGSRTWLEQALPHIPESESVLRSEALNAYAIALRHLGEVDAAHRIFDELDRLAQKNGSAHERVRALTNKANLLHETGAFAGALLLRLQALTLSERLHDAGLRSRLLVNKGLEQLAMGDGSGAERSLEEAALELVGTEDILSRALALLLGGKLALAANRVPEALGACHEALLLLGQEPAGILTARLKLCAAEAHNRLGQGAQAAPLLAACEHGFHSSGHRRLWIECLLQRARAAFDQKAMPQAEAYAHEARVAAREGDQLDLEHASVRLLADIAEQSGNGADALAHFREAESLRERWFDRVNGWHGALAQARHPVAGSSVEENVHSRVANLSDLNEELRRKNLELERLHHEKRELLTVIAHDLRNQLGATVNYTELALLSEVMDPVEVREQLHTIFSITRSTQELLEHLLSLERIESGQVPVVPEPLELCHWTGSLLERASSLGRMKAIRGEVHCPEDPVYLETDETWLRLALDNLLTNAFKYGPRGSLVVVRVESLPDRITIQVEDEGPGIAPEDRAHLFTKFHRTRNQPTGSEFSTGLGLYLVKQYAELLGCEAGFRPREPRGSIFYLEFPRE